MLFKMKSAAHGLGIMRTGGLTGKIEKINRFHCWKTTAKFSTALVDFFEKYPQALPFGDDIGDIVYLYMRDGENTGIFMADKGDFLKNYIRLQVILQSFLLIWKLSGFSEIIINTAMIKARMEDRFWASKHEGAVSKSETAPFICLIYCIAYFPSGP